MPALEQLQEHGAGAAVWRRLGQDFLPVGAPAEAEKGKRHTTSLRSSYVTGINLQLSQASPADQTESEPVPPSRPDALPGLLVIGAADGSARLETEGYANDGLTRSCAVLGSNTFLQDRTRLASTVYWALQARDWANGTGCGCSGAERFARHELALPSGPQWDQAVRIALLGDWIEPLFAGKRLDKTVYSRIKTEARTAHRQLVPLWRRWARRARPTTSVVHWVNGQDRLTSRPVLQLTVFTGKFA